MFEFMERCHSLADLLALRSSLRQQDTVLAGALRDVQQELRDWQQFRRDQEVAGQPVPMELLRLWEELAERERQLVLDLLQHRHLRDQVSEEIARLVNRHRANAG